MPDQCIDGDTGTADPAVCPDGEDGADAVIDIDDNDVADDKNVNGVDHPEVDFLELGGPSPTFHVWTGSRFTFTADGDAVLNNPAPCNSQFRVQVSTEDDFPPPSTVQSGWITVDRDPTTPDPPECYGTWSPSAAEWTGLQDAGAGTGLYYRATTRTPGPAVGDVRLSTEPRNGAWTLPPPYAVLTENGRSDYQGDCELEESPGAIA